MSRRQRVARSFRTCRDAHSAGFRRSPGQRVRRRRFQRSRAPSGRGRGGPRRNARDWCDPLPAHAHHIVIRPISPRARACSPSSTIQPSPASTWRGRTFRPRTVRAARIRAATSPPPASRTSVGARMPRRTYRLVTLAPEVPGALQLIEHLVQSGVRVAIGHTAASRDRSPTPSQPARRWRRIWATAARRSCPGTRTSIWELLAADEVCCEPDCRWPPLAAVHGEEPHPSERPRPDVLITDAIAAAGHHPAVTGSATSKRNSARTGACLCRARRISPARA